MPQEFCVLRCFSCQTFQVQIVKKSSKKWACKMCGEKQSIIKVYGQGTAKDCREHVQKLNMLQGTVSEIREQDPAIEAPSENSSEWAELSSPPSKRPKADPDPDPQAHSSTASKPYDNTECDPVLPKKKQSKWDCFLDPEDGAE